MEKNRERQIAFTRLFGAGRKVTIILPITFAAPVHVLTSARAVSLPPFRERSMAGRAALYIEAIRLMPARKRIRSRIPRFSFR